MKRFIGILLAIIMVSCAVLFSGCTSGDTSVQKETPDTVEELGTLLYQLNFDDSSEKDALEGGWTNVEGFGSYKDSSIQSDGRIWFVSSHKEFAKEDGEHSGFIRFTLPFGGDEIFDYHPKETAIELKKGTTYTFSFDARANADSEPQEVSKNYLYFAKEYAITSLVDVTVPNDNEWHTYTVNYTPQQDEVWGAANGDYIIFCQDAYKSQKGTFDIDNITIYEMANATVSFEIDGKVVATKTDVSMGGITFKQLISEVDFGEYAVPYAITYDGKTYTGAKDEGKIVFTSKDVTVSAEAKLKSPFAPTALGADIRTDSPIGLRFRAEMKTADQTVKQAGWIVTRKAFLDYANIDVRDFDMTCDVKMETIYNINEGQENKAITSENGTDIFSAVLTDIPVANYGDIMVARPFVVDGDGTWYGEQVICSAKDAANQMLDGTSELTDEQKAILQEVAAERFTYITLNKQKDKDFVVVNLTDMHLMAEEWENNSDNCRHYKATVNELVDRVKPDLITFSGDFCFAEGDLTPYEYQRDFIDSFDIPWTFTNGNHDIQYGDKFAHQIVDTFSEADNFIYESKDKDFGIANYVIGIEQDGEIIHSVILMDIYDRINVAVGDDGQEIKSWKSLNPMQREWYEKTINGLEEIGCNNSTLITHIPIKGFTKAYEAAFNKSFDAQSITLEDSYNGDCWNDGYKESYGIIRGLISDYGYDDDMIETIQALGNTKAVISGHDHVNNGVINYMGVDLAYSLKTGKSGKSDEKLNGGTCIIIDENGVGTVKHEYVYPENW